MRMANILPGCRERCVGKEPLALHMTSGFAKSEVMCTSQPHSKRQIHRGAGAEGTLRVMRGTVFRSKLLVV